MENRVIPIDILRKVGASVAISEEIKPHIRQDITDLVRRQLAHKIADELMDIIQITEKHEDFLCNVFSTCFYFVEPETVKKNIIII